MTETQKAAASAFAEEVSEAADRDDSMEDLAESVAWAMAAMIEKDHHRYNPPDREQSEEERDLAVQVTADSILAGVRHGNSMRDLVRSFGQHVDEETAKTALEAAADDVWRQARDDAKTALEAAADDVWRQAREALQDADCDTDETDR